MALLLAEISNAEPIGVRYPAGALHGYLIVSTLQGERLAIGDLDQTVHGHEVRCHLVFHFKDGSTDDEVTLFSQSGTFRLISDRHIQRGPSFPHPIDISIDAIPGQITMRLQDNGHEEIRTEHLELPPDLGNGVLPTLLANIAPASNQTTLSFVGGTPKPRLVHLVVSPSGEDTFLIANTHRKAIHLRVKVEIGGVAGVVAPILGKEPSDANVWFVANGVPTFVKAEQALYQGGPIWRIEPVTPVWSQSDQSR